MLNIALCDDQPEELAKLENQVEQYRRARPSLELGAFCCPSASYVLDAEVAFDIYLLDILMPGLNGIELGKELRTYAPVSPILYITNSPDFALSAYRTEAMGYLTKPIEQTEFFHAMDQAVLQSHKNKAGIIPVCVDEGVRGVYFHELISVEAAGWTLIFYLMESTVKSASRKVRFSDLWERLQVDGRFLMVRRGCLVNMDFIELIGHEFLQLADGRKIPIPKERRAIARKTYLEYCHNRLGGGKRV